MTISSSATTAPVTASRVMLAPENALAMSAPKAGPPVTLTTRSLGSPSLAASRSALTMSLSANPDSVESIGTGASAALPSVEGTTGIGGPPGPATETMRPRAASAAARSPEDRTPPSERVTTRITGAWSPPGKSLSSAAALADSALGGSDTGDLSAEPLSPSAPISPPPISTTSSASTQEKRPVSSPPMRSHSGRSRSGARCMPTA